ncbi:hypothetical protein [Salinicola endophyticus]|uniref:Curlin associated repeat-containing protein n=1 Tax=Salinicola endophyticus TaxID=1949083 RepID=A0AB74UFC0_9GAMM
MTAATWRIFYYHFSQKIPDSSPQRHQNYHTAKSLRIPMYHLWTCSDIASTDSRDIARKIQAIEGAIMRHTAFITHPIFSISILLILATLPAISMASEAGELDDNLSRNRYEKQIISQSDSYSEAIASPGVNRASVVQFGGDNRARIEQQNGRREAANAASIRQSGYANDALIDQRGGFNDGAIDQAGHSLDAKLLQQGSGYDAKINQRGANGAVTIQQSGTGHRAITVDQLSRSGSGATATIVTY